MAGRSRYSISSKGAGVKGGVLKNKLGITDQKSLDDAETLLLSDAYQYFFSQLDKQRLIFSIDRLLGTSLLTGKEHIPKNILMPAHKE